MTDIDKAFDYANEAGIAVKLPSGANFMVITQGEADYLNERVGRYLTDNKFVNVSDVQDIDRMVTFELFVHRWSLWLSRGQDYFGDEIVDRQVAERIGNFSTEIRQLKKSLGVDKVARDRVTGDDSLAAHWSNLKSRAAEFAVTRNEQAVKAIELFQQLKALLTYHDNTDELEQREGEITTDDLIDWIRTVAIPEFDTIDTKFRTEQQKYWVRSQ